MILILFYGLLISPLTLADNLNKPVLQEFWIPKNLAENKTIRLNCALIQGESVNFEWFLNDHKLEQNSKRRIVQNEESSELVIKSLSVDDIGEIKCIGKNKYGQDSQKMSLIFNGNQFKKYF